MLLRCRKTLAAYARRAMSCFLAGTRRSARAWDCRLGCRVCFWSGSPRLDFICRAARRGTIAPLRPRV